MNSRPTMWKIAMRFFLLISATAVLLCGSLNSASMAQDHDHPREDHDHSHIKAEIFTTRDNAGQQMPLPKAEDMFHFVVFGDRTGGPPEGIEVLKQAVIDTKLLDPDLVMTVGDLINGYNTRPGWMVEMQEFRDVMSGLDCPWYPVAGNHDIYWRGDGNPPAGEHESNYEKHFGPLWYAFAHKNAGFIVLYSDEGDFETGEKGFNEGSQQQMSPEQLKFLAESLEKFTKLDHVLVFLHHPRWITQRYKGSNWPATEKLLTDAGNVTAVFAGHIHQMQYAGPRGNRGSEIQHYTLATTGGYLHGDIPNAGFLHHFNVVTVREDRISVAAIPVGGVIDPKEFTQEFHDSIDEVEKIRPIPVDGDIVLNVDGSATGLLRYRFRNKSLLPVEVTVSIQAGADRWTLTPDHQHFELPADDSNEISILIKRDAGVEWLEVPVMDVAVTAIGATSRIAMPPFSVPLPVQVGKPPAEYFEGQVDHFLQIEGKASAVRIKPNDHKFADGPMTVEAWLRPRETIGFTAAVANSQSSGYSIFVDEGVPQFDLHVGGEYVTVKASDKLPIDRWSHVAGVFNGEKMTIFVDGEPISSSPAAGVRKTNRLPLYIGAEPNGRGAANRPFVGDIDEVRLTSAAIYNQPFKPSSRLKPSEDTVILMHMDAALGPFLISDGPRSARGFLSEPSALIAK